MMDWFEQCSLELQSHQGTIILHDDGRWGSDVLCQHLAHQVSSCIWLVLTERDRQPELQSMSFARAVNAAFNERLLSEHVSIEQNLSAFSEVLKVHGPLTVFVMAAECAPEYAQTLLRLQSEDCQLVMQFARVCADFELPSHGRVFGEHFLKLSQDEARKMVPSLQQNQFQSFYMQTQGAYNAFMAKLQEEEQHIRRVGLFTESKHIDHLEQLLEQEKACEALEYAVYHYPKQVAVVLTENSRIFWAQADPEKIFTLLKRVPANYRKATVLMWQLAMALQIDKEDTLIAEVEDFLQQYSDAELRAFYAASRRRAGDPEGHLAQAEKAAFDKRTFITLTHYGSALILTDPTEGIKVLEEALRLAETKRQFYWASLCGLKLAEQFAIKGEYANALTYAQWGLKLQNTRINNRTLRLRLINECAFVSVLTGSDTSFEQVFSEEAEEVEQALPAIKQLLKGTLADYYLSQHKRDKAFQIYQELWENNVRRENYGFLTLHYVRALVDLQYFEKAVAVAEEAVGLTRNLPSWFQRDAMLAYGIALAMTNPQKAIPLLEKSFVAFAKPQIAYRQARAALYLSYAYLQLGDRNRAQAVLNNAHDCLAELTQTGLAYMAGPEVLMAATFAMLEQKTDQKPLEIYALRESLVVYEGKPVSIRPRQLEILVVLAMHPKGLSGEKLTLAVYGESANTTVCKNEINRLRKEVGIPIKSRPYRLDIPVWGDFLEIVELVKENKLSDAVELYNQPFLSYSESPRIVNQRELIEEMLRQAVLNAGSADALHTLAIRLKDDLILWEAVQARLPIDDNRRPVALAYSEQLKNEWSN